MNFESIDNGRAYEDHDDLLKKFSQIEGVTEVSSNVHLNSVWLTFGKTIERVNVEVELEKRENETEVIIKNITASVRGQGLGSGAVESIITWAHNEGWETIIARDVVPAAEEFWKRRGFIYDEKPENISHDWIYKPRN